MDIENSNEKKKKFTWENFMELFKWFITSVVIVTITLIIDKGFKERTAGIQEMQAFDKYVEIILKADNIEERWKLSEFFSTVTPTDRLRNKWTDYKDLISVDYEKFKNLKATEITLREEIEKGKSPEALNKLIKIKKQLEPYERRLAEPTTTIKNSEISTADISSKSPLTFGKDSEANLKKFKEQIKQDLKTDTRYQIDEILEKANLLNNKVVQDLQAELGETYSTIQSGVGKNFKDQTFGNRYGVFLKVDPDKKIWPFFFVKVTENEVIVTMAENEITETFKTPRNNIDWENMQSFVRNYFLNRLNQLR